MHKVYPKEVEIYVSDLYDRRNEGTIVPLAIMEGGNWQPIANQCHDNVDIYCQHDNKYQPVRGWLFFDYGYLLNTVSFLQHSVLKFPDGKMYDITPTPSFENYPFIIANETDEEFFKKEKHTDNGNLYHIHNTA
jgi:hypothetical protein